MCCGGVGTGGPTRLTVTETWNGGSWYENGDLNTARNQSVGGGATNTAALNTGGELPTGSPAASNATEEFTGTSDVTKTISTD